MTFNPFNFLFPKKYVGVDIGTSAVRMVEISKWGQGKTLENYGEIRSTALFEESFKTFNESTNLLSEYFTARALGAILDEAEIKTNSAIFSLPDFSTFFTTFELPPMKKSELEESVKLNAPQHIPLPINETMLDWHLIKGVPGEEKSRLKILLAAIPKEVVESYKKTAKLANLDLYAVEPEVFGIIRATLSRSKKTVCLVDIGAQSSTVSIVEKGVLKRSHSAEFSGNKLTHAISSSLGVSYKEAEKIKWKRGLSIDRENGVKNTLSILIDPFLKEIKRVLIMFSQAENKQVDQIYLSGGSANLPGLKEYIHQKLEKETIVPNCFSNILTPPILSEKLKQMSPRFSVSMGVALQGLEER